MCVACCARPRCIFLVFKRSGTHAKNVFVFALPQCTSPALLNGRGDLRLYPWAG